MVVDCVVGMVVGWVGRVVGTVFMGLLLRQPHPVKIAAVRTKISTKASVFFIKIPPRKIVCETIISRNRGFKPEKLNKICLRNFEEEKYFFYPLLFIDISCTIEEQ